LTLVPEIRCRLRETAQRHPKPGDTWHLDEVFMPAEGQRPRRARIVGILEELRALPACTQITRHDCVEGWSCIGEWTGVPL